MPSSAIDKENTMTSIRILNRPAPLVLAGLLLAQSFPAHSADMPRRKAGLWEINTQMAGMPNPGPVQQCIDARTDNLMQERAQAEKMEHKCSAMDVKTQGNKVLIHSVCKIDATTATTDAVITGSFETGYRNEMTVRYDPPMMGMATTRMTQEAKWLGPCKPGQKPGDVIMPGMGKFNMQDMQKNQKQMEEMMKRRQGQ